MMTAEYLSALAALYPPDKEIYFELRLLVPAWNTESEKRSYSYWYLLESPYIENAARFCREMAQEWDVYIGVLPRVWRGKEAAHVPYGSVLFSDVDGGTDGPEGAIRRVKRSGLPKPHMAIVSGGGLHCYWLMSETIPLETESAKSTYKSTLRRLCLAIGGKAPFAHADTTGADIARILRVPGTFNRKRQHDPRPVRMIRYAPDAPRLSYADWRKSLPTEPIPTYAPIARPAPIRHDDVVRLPPTTIDMMQRTYAEGEKYPAIRRILASARHCGFDESALYIIGQTFVQRHGCNGKPVETLVRDTMRRIAPNP
jgi:hypothetical protein